MQHCCTARKNLPAIPPLNSDEISHEMLGAQPRPDAAQVDHQRTTNLAQAIRPRPMHTARQQQQQQQQQRVDGVHGQVRVHNCDAVHLTLVYKWIRLC